MRTLRLTMVMFFWASAGVGQNRERARALHQDAVVFDAHVHMINRQFYQGGDIGQRLTGGQVDLVRAREGGLDAMFFSLFVTEDYYPARMETKQVLRLLDLALRQIEANREKIAVAHTAGELERIVQSGRMAAVLDLEGGFDLDGDLGVLRMLYRLGFRSLQLAAHNWANNFADSCCAPKRWKGLSARGREVVREMNRLGMVINVSHAADETIEQVLEISSHPVVATHHGLRSFNDIPRNMPEDLLKKLAAKGGLIGFHIGNEFHNRRLFDYRTRNAGRPFWDTEAIRKQRPPASIEKVDEHVRRNYSAEGIQAPEELKFTVEDWLRVVERAIELVGEDHVTLGSDWDGGPTLPRGMRDISDLPMLTEGMLRRGWSEGRIRKFLGGNLLRVFRQVTEGKTGQ